MPYRKLTPAVLTVTTSNSAKKAISATSLPCYGFFVYAAPANVETVYIGAIATGAQVFPIAAGTCWDGNPFIAKEGGMHDLTDYYMGITTTNAQTLYILYWY